MTKIRFRLNLRTMWLINLIVFLLGVIFIYISFTMQAGIGKTLIEAIGTSFFVSGFVSVLATLFIRQPVFDGVRVASVTRDEMSRSLKDRKYHAKKIDIVAFSMSECLRELAEDTKARMINLLLTQKVRMRLLFVHPEAHILKQRAVEDGYLDVQSLVDRQLLSVRYSVLIFKRLKERYCEIYDKPAAERATEPSRLGIFEIRMIDVCPHITTDRADNSIMWGFYLSSNPGLNSSMFIVNASEQPEVFDQLKNHFYGLWRTPTHHHENDCLVRMLVGILKPSLNGDLAERLLGVEVMNELLGNDWRSTYKGYLFSSVKPKGSARRPNPRFKMARKKKHLLQSNRPPKNAA